MEQHINNIINANQKEAIDMCFRKGMYYLAHLLAFTNFENMKDYESLNLLNRTNLLFNKDYSEKEITCTSEEGTFDTHLYKVMLTCNWCDSRTLCELWNKMSKGDYTWNNIKIVWEEPCDYYVVINKPYLNFNPPMEKSIIFHQEPYMTEEKWGIWANPPKNCFYIGSHNLTYNNNEWHLSKTYNELLSLTIDKTELNKISTILSDKYTDPGHINRIDFVKFLERKNIPIDIYGNNKFKWKDYKGELPYHQKDNGLFPYKYTFNAENNSINNYYTEKIIDAILSECLIFYWGCPNLENYIDSRAFVRLDMDNFEESLDTIKTAIKEDWWSDRIKYIKKEKNKILNDLQFFPRLQKIIEV
tara:strand:+ start:22783 stop:23859 length:1077 start_codon:yes stop_codon:yes gene_type:complete